MDTDHAIDLEAIFEVIDSSEVMVFRFVTVPQRLLFDPRHNDMDAPLLKTVPRAGSLEERFKHLKQLRPRFKIPDRITAIWWPKYIHSLADSRVWERVQQRIAKEGYPEEAAQTAVVLEELQRLEREEIVNAIRGANYHSLWERHR